MATERDPNVPESEQHPGAPPEGAKRRVGEDGRSGEEKPRTPIGNGQLPDEPAAFPPHA